MRAVPRTALRLAVSAVRTSPVVRAVYQRAPVSVRRARVYHRHHGRLPRLLRPQSLSEKINWRICFDRRELIAWTCDKLRMKEEAQRRDPGIGVPATIWSGTDLSELAALELPARWVLKANHASQLVHLGEGRPSLAELERITDGWLDPSFQEKTWLEWAYGRARRCLLVEEWIGDEQGAPPSDLKFFCFDGQVAMIQLHMSRFADHTVAYYDPEWRRLPVTSKQFSPAPDIARPTNLQELLDHASRLSAGFDFIRVDLYDTERGVYLGEFTPYPSSGLFQIEPRSFDRSLGDLWTLPRLRR